MQIKKIDDLYNTYPKQRNKDEQDTTNTLHTRSKLSFCSHHALFFNTVLIVSKAGFNFPPKAIGRFDHRDVTRDHTIYTQSDFFPVGVWASAGLIVATKLKDKVGGGGVRIFFFIKFLPLQRKQSIQKTKIYSLG